MKRLLSGMRGAAMKGAALAALLLCSTGNSAVASDNCAWVPTFGGAPGMDESVRAFTVFDPPGTDSGPALYAGGGFTTAGGVTANRIAKWDGTAWSALGSGMDSSVHALTVFDDGSGPALYAGGWFTVAGGQPANRIARWGAMPSASFSWSALGSGMNSLVIALTVFDDGKGPALYAGGVFIIAGGVEANRIAKWDGESWSPLGNGVPGTWSSVDDLTVFDDGAGPALYVGGRFTTAGGVEANRIAKWDGESWSALGSGMNGWVRALTVFDDGTGPALYAGGEFTVSPAGDSFLAKWSCVPTCVGDITGDGITHHADLAALLAAWNTMPGDPNWNTAADLDGDGHIGHGDLAALLADWGCGM